MKRKHTRFLCRSAVLAGALASLFLSAIRAPAVGESGISATGAQGACFESDLKDLLQSCIASNQTSAPPGNPGPFTRGYKEIVLLMAQCFGGGFTNLVCLGDNVIVGAAADDSSISSAGIPSFTGDLPISSNLTMLWADNVFIETQLNENRPLKDTLDAVRAADPDPSAMTPPPVFSSGGDSIVLGDPMGTQPTNSFHAVLFAGINDLAGAKPGEVSPRLWLLAKSSTHALDEMRRTLTSFLNVPEENIDERDGGTYADLQSMITNAWSKMNDNEQFILFVADHGTTFCTTNPATRMGGFGFSADFLTEPYLKDPAIEKPSVGLKTSFVGQAGQVRFNTTPIGNLPPSASPTEHEFVFNPNLIYPVGQMNTVEIVVPDSDAGVDFVTLSAGPVLGGDIDFGYEPFATVVNVRNATGSNKSDFNIVFDGRVDAGATTHAQRTQADGTSIADWAVGGFTHNYDSSSDLTTFYWQDIGTPIANGDYASFSVTQPGSELRPLRYAWAPVSQATQNDHAPVNIVSIETVTVSDFDLQITAAPIMPATQNIDTVFMYTPIPIPTGQFHFTDAAVTGLTIFATESLILAPDSADVWTVPLPSMSPKDPLPTIVMDTDNHWNTVATPNDVRKLDQLALLPPQDTSITNICPGQGAVMTINSVTNGNFKWYCDGVEIPGETNATFTVTNLTATDSGVIYTGIGTNATECKRKFFINIVEDVTPPTIICPADISVEQDEPGGAFVSYSVGASESCGIIDGSTFECFPPSGSLFPIGVTFVTCNVSDTFGNTAVCSFAVTVEPSGGGPDAMDEFFNPNIHYTVGDPVSGFSGGFYLTETPDLDLGGSLRVFLQRHFDSKLFDDGDVNSPLGVNWQHNYDITLSVETTNATAVYRQGRILRFAHDGTNWNITGRADIPFQLLDAGPEFLLADPRSQHLYLFGTNGLLQRIEDGRGNTNSLSYSGGLLRHVTDHLNRDLHFDYDPDGMLTNVSDGVRSVRYAHSATNLTSFIDALGNATTYTYDPGSASNPALMTSRTLPEGNTPVSNVFDAAGRVVSQVDAASNVTFISYTENAGQRISTYTNAIGDTQVQVYNPSGELTLFTDEAGNSIDFESDSAGRRNRITDRRGHTTEITYDNASGFPTLIDHPENGDEQYSYSTRNLSGVTFFDLTRTVLPDFTTNLYAYDAHGNLVSHTNRLGDASSYTYDDRGQLLSVVNPLGGTIAVTYDTSGRISSSTDSDIGVTTYAYDVLNRLTNLVHPDSTAVQFTFDARDRLTSVTDERNNTTSYMYNDNSRLTNITDALGQDASFEFDSLNRPVRMTDRAGHSAYFDYDPRGLLVSISNRNGFVTRYNYDERRRLTAVVNPAGATNSLEHDPEGLLTALISPLGEAYRLERDAMGYVTNVIDPMSNTIRLARDDMKRVTRRIDPLGHVTAFAYDKRGFLTNVNLELDIDSHYFRNPLGLVTNLVDPNSDLWRFDFSPVGRLTESVDPLSRSTQYAYDSRGRANFVTFGDGETLSSTYDGVGNTVMLDYSDGTVLRYDYDPLNRLTNASGTEAFALMYDVEGRITNTRQSGVDFGSAHDPDGRLTNTTYNSGQLIVTYTYDTRDRLIHVCDNITSQGMNFGFDEADRLVSITRSNGVSSTYTYDPAGRIIRIEDGSLIDIRYVLDAAGRVTEVDFVSAPIDPLSVLTNESASYGYDSASQISSPGYAYDSRGRLTNEPNAILTWDAASRLTTIGDASFAYNAFDDLAVRSTTAMTNRFFYNYAIGSAPIVGERNDNSGQFERFYVWSPGGMLLYVINLPGNTVSYPHFDRVGSTLALTDNGGVVTDAYAYGAYGRVLAKTGINMQPFQFVGRSGVRFEQAGNFNHMRARYFDPETARFLSIEPIWPVLEDPRKLNPYQYALQNPLGLIDPDGTDEEYVEQDVEDMSAEELVDELFVRLKMKNEIKEGRDLTVEEAQEIHDRLEDDLLDYYESQDDNDDDDDVDDGDDDDDGDSDRDRDSRRAQKLIKRLEQRLARLRRQQGKLQDAVQPMTRPQDPRSSTAYLKELFDKLGFYPAIGSPDLPFFAEEDFVPIPTDPMQPNEPEDQHGFRFDGVQDGVPVGFTQHDDFTTGARGILNLQQTDITDGSTGVQSGF